MFGLEVLGVMIVLVGLGIILNGRKAKALRAAPRGALRIESVKAQHLNSTLAMYQRAGWVPVQQSSAKSLGSQARITVTFRKGAE